MRKDLKVGLWISTGLVAVSLLLVRDVLFGFAPITNIRGDIETRMDVAHDHYRELGYGLPMPWRPRYEALLRQRYGVEFKAVAGCIVWKSLRNYVAAYNRVSVAAANRKYGHDIFKEVSDEAKSDWELGRRVSSMDNESNQGN